MNALRYMALVAKADELGARGAMLDQVERAARTPPDAPEPANIHTSVALTLLCEAIDRQPFPPIPDHLHKAVPRADR